MGFGGADQRTGEGHNQPQTRSDPVIRRFYAPTTVDVSKPLQGILSPCNPLENSPSDETNAESIQAHETAIIKLKITRNSLLNISKLPPEVLGNVFRWNAAPTSDFLGWVDRTHNFLLVCHHWFEVASRTPELWSFWGTTPKEWKRCCVYSKTAPLDLVLDVHLSLSE